MKFRYETEGGVGFVTTHTPAGHNVPVASIPSVLSEADQSAIGTWIANTLNTAHADSVTVTAIADLDRVDEMAELRSLLSE